MKKKEEKAKKEKETKLKKRNPGDLWKDNFILDF